MSRAGVFILGLLLLSCSQDRTKRDTLDAGPASPPAENAPSAPTPMILDEKPRCPVAVIRAEQLLASAQADFMAHGSVENLERVQRACGNFRQSLAEGPCELEGQILLYEGERRRSCEALAEELEARRRIPPSPPPTVDEPPATTPKPAPTPSPEESLASMSAFSRIQFIVKDARALSEVSSEDILFGRRLIEGRPVGVDVWLKAVSRGQAGCAVYSADRDFADGEKLLSVSVSRSDDRADVEILAIGLQRTNGRLVALQCLGKDFPTPARLLESVRGVLGVTLVE